MPKGSLPLGLATACADLGAQVTGVQARLARIDAALTPVAERLPAYALLRSIPGVGSTVAAILLAEIGEIGSYTQFSQLRKLADLDIVRVQSGQFARKARISKCGRGLLRWALYHAAVGAARTAAGRARLAVLKAKRRGDRFAGFKAIVELAAKVLRVVWGGCGRAAPPTTPPERAGTADRESDVVPGELAARDCNVAAPHGDRGGTAARRSRSQQPGPGRVDPARECGDRMAPLRWGVRDLHGCGPRGGPA